MKKGNSEDGDDGSTYDFKHVMYSWNEHADIAARKNWTTRRTSQLHEIISPYKFSLINKTTHDALCTFIGPCLHASGSLRNIQIILVLVLGLFVASSPTLHFYGGFL